MVLNTGSKSATPITANTVIDTAMLDRLLAVMDQMQQRIDGIELKLGSLTKTVENKVALPAPTNEEMIKMMQKKIGEIEAQNKNLKTSVASIIDCLKEK